MAKYFALTFCCSSDASPCHPNLFLLKRARDSSFFLQDPEDMEVLKHFSYAYCNHQKCPWIYCMKLRVEEYERLIFHMSFVLKSIDLGRFEIKERSNFTRVPRVLHRFLTRFNYPGSLFSLQLGTSMYDSTLVAKIILSSLHSDRRISRALRGTCLHLITPMQLQDIFYNHCSVDMIIPSMKTLSSKNLLFHRGCTAAPLHPEGCSDLQKTREHDKTSGLLA